MGFRCETRAAKVYQKRVLIAMSAYMAVLFGSARIVRHDHPSGWHVYFWSVLPAVPIILVLVAMARYLHEETDEYQRLRNMYAILMGTATLLGVLVVNDFLRAFANASAIPPFTSFVIFCFAMAITSGVQKIRDRVSDDEPAA